MKSASLVRHSPTYGEQTLQGGKIDRHRHDVCYAALVLSGHYEEVGDTGRWVVQPGDVIVHRPHESHLNRIGDRGASVLNVRLPVHTALPTAFQIARPDDLISAAQSDSDAVMHLLEPHCVLKTIEADWPDMLARELRSNPGLEIGAWSQSAGLAPATVSRGFTATYGATPSSYRSVVRAQRAWRQILFTQETFATIAYEQGFADQAHFCRALRSLTGFSPSGLRRSISFKKAHQVCADTAPRD